MNTNLSTAAPDQVIRVLLTVEPENVADTEKKLRALGLSSIEIIEGNPILIVEGQASTISAAIKQLNIVNVQLDSPLPTN